jgi:hypothetical protein
VKKYKTLLFVYFMFLLNNTYCQNIFKEKLEPQKSTLKIKGFLDTYYLYNNHGFDSNLGLVSYERVLDQKANNISFGTAYLSGNLVLKGFEAKIDFSFKRNFEYIDIGSSFTPLGSKVGKSGLHLRQLYVAYNFKKTRWVIGQYESNIGSETMVQPQTLFYSLSYAFSNSPLYHRGIKTEIKLSKKLQLDFGFVNDYRKEDIYVKNVNIHSQVIYKPIKKLDFSFGV